MNALLNRKAMIAIVLAGVLTSIVATPATAAPPSNDNDESPTIATLLPFDASQGTRDATTEEGDPSCFGNGHNVWYAYTATENTRILAHTFGSDYDTTLGVYTGVPGALSRVDCNDDSYTSNAPRASRVSFAATPGITYYFMVSSFGSSRGGNLNFHLLEAPAVEVYIDTVGWINEITGGPTITGTIACSQEVDVEISLYIVQRQNGNRETGGAWTQVEDCNASRRGWMAADELDDFKFGEAVVSATISTPDGRFQVDETLLLRTCTRIGTLGPDRMEGTSRNDRLCGLAGNDTLIGNGGSDILFGYNGVDDVRGGEGDDDVYGGNGSDELKGNNGDDLVNGADGNDDLQGGGGSDRCVGGKGRNGKRGCER